MRATDVMTSEVITVDADTSVQTAAKLMAEHSISALPVVDRDNRIIGMVSEGDLLHRAETGTERRRSWWLEMMASTNRHALDPIGFEQNRDVGDRGLFGDREHVMRHHVFDRAAVRFDVILGEPVG